MKAKKLFVEMVLPVIGEPHSHIAFTRWMPQEEDFIILENESITTKLWFDKKEPKKGFSKHISVLVHQVYITAIVEDIEPDLLSYIQKMDPKKGPTKEQEEIHKRYHQLGEEVYKATIKSYNRLIKYFRDFKKQFWLEEYSIDVGSMSSIFSHFNAKANINNGNYFRWRPAIAHISHIMINKDDTSGLLKKEEWEDLKNFVCSNQSPPLHLSLLAGAEKLYSSGHTRSAITEAITALEVSLFEFSENADAEAIFKEKLADRVDVDSLKKFVAHLGLSSSINYLLPLLFSEEQIPKRLLKTCQEALAVRQNVVHNGQRNVGEYRLNKYISAIRKLCSIFEEFKKT